MDERKVRAQKYFLNIYRCQEVEGIKQSKQFLHEHEEIARGMMVHLKT